MPIVFDLETTGLMTPSENLSEQPGIVELAAVKYSDEWEELARISQLVDPEVFFQEKAQEITGITPDMLVGAPTYRAIHSKVAQLFLGEKHLIGFNIDFDTQVLHYNLLRYGLDRRFPWPPMHHDLMKISKDHLNLQGKQDQKYANLSSLHEALFGVKFDGAHRAIEDVLATGRCAAELHKRGLLWLT